MAQPRGRLRRGSKTKVGRRADEIRLAVGRQIQGIRVDAHLSQQQVSDAAGIPQPYWSRIEHGMADPSIAVLAAMGGALGAEVTIRFYPGTGPRIRDRIQAPMVEELVRRARGSWRSLVEVPVWRPARGVIDLVLARPGDIVIAVEVQSEIRRFEQQLRWSAEKAAALPSCEAWSMLSGGQPTVTISRLLVLRSTPSMRALARSFEATFATTYPARAADAVASLGDASKTWPGDAVVWMEVSAAGARILDRPPRGVSLGR